MMKNMRMGVPNLLKSGAKHMSGKEQTILKNIEACQQLATLTRTSLGPNGMNKMVINHIDKLYVTSDSTTIMSQMEVEHPAAKLMVLAAQMQEQEVGDGSNFVIAFSGELLTQADILIRMGLHVNDIMAGFELAFKKANEILPSLVVLKMDSSDLTKEENIVRGIHTSIGSKQYSDATLLANLVAKACTAVMPANTSNFNVDNVRVCKLHGGSLDQSEVVRGMVINHDVVGTISNIKDAKVAVFTCPVECAQTETKGSILLENATDVMNYSMEEEKAIQKAILEIKESGVNVVISGGTVSEMGRHFLDKYGILCVKITSQHELRRIARATQARLLVKLGPVSPEDQGHCAHVFVREFGLNKVTIFQHDQNDTTAMATIVLRGSTQNVLDDVERAVDDGVNIAKAMGRDARFLAGGGAWQIELARRLQDYGQHKEGLEQYAIKGFADALEVVPRTLSENAGMVAMDIISQLYAAHEKKQPTVGVDVEGGGIRDMAAQQIFDHLGAMEQALGLAVNTVTTILRVDQIIMSKPAGGPKAPSNQGHWDDD